MSRPKGSKNKPKDFAAVKTEPKKRGRPPKVKIDLFDTSVDITFDQEKMVEQEERIEKIELLTQEEDELAGIDELLRISREKLDKQQANKVKEEYHSGLQKVRMMMGDDYVDGFYCGKSQCHKGSHIIRTLNPRTLAFVPESHFTYVSE